MEEVYREQSPRCEHEVRRAVACECIIKLWMLMQIVQAPQIIQKHGPGALWIGRRPVQVNVFVAIVGADPDEVAFRSDKVNKSINLIMRFARF
jgi:hypothetical protein